MSAQPTSASQFTPVRFLATGAQRYGDATGVAAPWADYRHVQLDPVLGQRISAAYMAAPAWDQRALPAYRAFCDETIAQFHFLTGTRGRGPVRRTRGRGLDPLCRTRGRGLDPLGVTVEVVDYDPYETAQAMAADLRRRRLRVYSTRASGNPHPYLSDAVNDMFRAVHDAFGHAASGRGFDQDGEEAAWLKHCAMYSPLARRALTTETRGQSCALLFHYQGRRFPGQKLALLPEWCGDPPRTNPTPMPMS